ncbi:hypothetical protein BJ166DRAFT_496494 [Pestalotiopsis sp. NC0098]|nr:hypothetical protein BJ166DRAFT_496494 [Pestalotiopsis sp. NC0098]
MDDTIKRQKARWGYIKYRANEEQKISVFPEVLHEQIYIFISRALSIPDARISIRFMTWKTLHMLSLGLLGEEFPQSEAGSQTATSNEDCVDFAAIQYTLENDYLSIDRIFFVVITGGKRGSGYDSSTAQSMPQPESTNTQNHHIEAEDFKTQVTNETSFQYTMPDGLNYVTNILPYRLQIQWFLGIHLDKVPDSNQLVISQSRDSPHPEFSRILRQFSQNENLWRAHEYFIRYFTEVNNTNTVPDISLFMHRQAVKDHEARVARCKQPSSVAILNSVDKSWPSAPVRPPPRPSPNSPYFDQRSSAYKTELARRSILRSSKPYTTARKRTRESRRRWKSKRSRPRSPQPLPSTDESANVRGEGTSATQDELANCEAQTEDEGSSA